MNLRICLLAVFVALSGCKHLPQSAARKYASAPRIQNPLALTSSRVPGFTNEADALLFGSFDGRQLCFDGQNTQAPAQATGTRYSLRVLNTDDVDLKTAPTDTASLVQVLGSQSQLVPVTRTVEDVVRDANGRTVATVSRQVQELETVYQTQLRICFPGAPQLLSAESRFMVLLREGGEARMWGIPTRPRGFWVWRLPGADVPLAPSAASSPGARP